MSLRKRRALKTWPYEDLSVKDVSPFWRRVRELRKEIAVELYMLDHKHLDFCNTPEATELKEGGYWDKARILALKRISEEVCKPKTHRSGGTEDG